MSWKVFLSIVIIFAIGLGAGCSMINDFWPAKVSTQAIKFAHKDPNNSKYQWWASNIGTARELRNDVIDVYIGQQLLLQYQASLNKEKYQQALNFLDLSIKQAEAERTAAIGTLQNPGWLLTGLLTLLPVGSYLAGWKTQRPQDYTEQEVQDLIAKTKAEAQKIPDLAKNQAGIV